MFLPKIVAAAFGMELQTSTDDAPPIYQSLNSTQFMSMGLPFDRVQILPEEIQRRKTEGAPFWCVDCQTWKFNCVHGKGRKIDA